MRAIACGLHACTVCQEVLTVHLNLTFNLPRLYFSSSHKLFGTAYYIHTVGGTNCGLISTVVGKVLKIVYN